MPTSGRTRTSPPGTSPPISSTSRGSPRPRPGSAATSGPASTIRSMLLSTLATMLGLHRARSSPMMSPRDRSPGSPRGRRRRKGGFTTGMESVTATDIALPGLEKAVMTEPATGHWIERGPQKRLMVFSGRSHYDLAAQIAERLGVELGDVEVDTFANGETYTRYLESIRGADIFIVQTGCQPVDRHLMELMFMIHSAKRITAVMPLFPYARQDRKARPREPISARLVADMIQLAGADRVLTMDLHAGQIQGFFTIPVDHMTALPLFARHFRDLGLTGPEIVSVAPDEGRAKMAVRFAEMIEADFAIMHKTRPDRDRRRRRDHDRRDADRERQRATRAGREGRVGVRHPRRVLRRRARALPGRTDRRDRRHRHGSGEPARGAAEHDDPPRGAAPRRDDHERFRRRLGVRHFRRRHPVVLDQRMDSARPGTRLVCAVLGSRQRPSSSRLR